jgi:hypothetical protein
MADPVVHITAGIPDSGTGNITTLGQTLLDGANIAVGATTDAVVAAGATGSLSAKLRAISRDIVANIVLAAGTNVIGHFISDTGSTTAVTQATAANLNATVVGTGTFATQATLAAETTKVIGTVNLGGNSYNNITTATTTTVKSGAGTLAKIIINQTGTVSSTATIWDSLTGSGNKIGTLDTLGSIGSVAYDVAFSTGLTIVTTGTAAPNLTISYR